MRTSGACARMRERHPYQGAGARARRAGPPCSPCRARGRPPIPAADGPRPSFFSSWAAARAVACPWGSPARAAWFVEVSGRPRRRSAGEAVLHRGIHRRYLPATRVPEGITRRRPRGRGRPSMCAAIRRALGVAGTSARCVPEPGISASHEPCDGSASRVGRHARREPMSAWRYRRGRCITLAARFPRFERASHGCGTVPRGSRPSTTTLAPSRASVKGGPAIAPGRPYLRRGSSRAQPARRVTERLRAVSTSTSLVTVRVSR